MILVNYKKLLLLFLFSFFSFQALYSAQQKSIENKKQSRFQAINSYGEKLSSEALVSVADKINKWQNSTHKKSPKNKIPFTLPKTQKQALITMERELDNNIKINWSENNKAPIFIQSPDLQPKVDKSKTIVELSETFSKKSKYLFGLVHEDDKFFISSSHTDELGMQHVRMQQTYANIPVYGKDIYLHYDRLKNLQSVNGRVAQTNSELNVQPSLPAVQAESNALKELNLTNESDLSIASQLVWYPTNEEQINLAYLVNVNPNLAEHWEVFVDAQTGTILKKANRVCYDGPVNGSGVDLAGQTQNFSTYQIGSDYYLIDTSKPMFDAAKSKFPNEVAGGIVILDAQNGEGQQLFFNMANDPNQWNVPNAISAVNHGRIVYDYYNSVHNRNSIDGKGGSMLMVVNFNKNFNNAFWNGQYMVFGNGDGQEFSDLAGALDVTAHEMTHGVVENSANLIYENQSGALNESFSDVFGVSAEFFHRGTNANWLVGEDVTTPAVPGDALRDMIEPGGSKVAGSKQPAHMNQYQNLPNTPEGDNGGVHINSGIPNRAYYLVAQDIGIEKAEKIYYRALTNYLTRSSQFIDARLALIKSAADLHGENSAEQTAIKNAFDSVGILDGNASPEPPVIPEVQGQDFILAVDAGTGALYRVSPDGQSIKLVTSTPVLNKPTVTDDGSSILFVDTSYNPRIVALDGSGEQLLDDTGAFWNLAISPDGKKLAATANVIDGLIYLFDLENSNNSTQLPLYSQTYTEGEKASTVLFADALDWTLDSQYIVYDALNYSITTTGDTLEYWDINFLRSTDGTVIRAFPPQPLGVNIGNPVLASNKDFIMAFDYFDENGQVTIVGVNLETGQTATITENDFAPGRPDFSPDDQFVIYEYTDGVNFGVFITGLQNDGITGEGNDQLFLTGAIYPIWITFGNRPATDVNPESRVKLPSELALMQNYPNPFNPQTTIRFDLPNTEKIKIAVYDMLGREVALLVNGTYPAGSHSIKFDGTNMANGVYFYKLQAGNRVETRKMLLMK